MATQTIALCARRPSATTPRLAETAATSRAPDVDPLAKAAKALRSSFIELRLQTARLAKRIEALTVDCEAVRLASMAVATSTKEHVELLGRLDFQALAATSHRG